MRFQLFAARLALVLLALAITAALAAVVGVRLSLMDFSNGYFVMAGAACLSIAALGMALCWAYCAFQRNRGEGQRAGLTALLGSLVLLAGPVHTAYMSLTSPPINDATTDPEDPPQFVALAKARGPGMNSPAYDGSRQIAFRGESNTVNYMLHTFYTDITLPKPELLNTKTKLFWHAFETAKQLGWRIVDYSENDGRIEATDSSFWFGQKADIVIRVRQAGAIGARLDARSQSETGTRDFGSNIARLKALRAAL
jgi:hypothetical protein